MADAEAQFREGTFIGSSFKDIEEKGIFGRLVFKKAKMGKWNTPHRLEYAGGLRDENPYVTEVGFFTNKEAAYFLIQKRGLARGSKMSKQEVVSHLKRVARGGNWDDGVKGKKGDHSGTLYTYTHKVDSKMFRLFGYRTHNSRQVLIYVPSVSPNLGGTSRAPLVLLH